MAFAFGTMVGGGSAEWARELFGAARHDAWLSVLLAAVLVSVFGSLIVWAVALHPDAPAGGLFTTALGSWAGMLLNLGLLFYTLARAARVSRAAVEMLHFAVLPRTPTWVLLLLALTVTGVVLMGGIESLLSYQLSLLWPTVLVAVLSVGLGYRLADWANFLPVLSDGMLPVLRGVRTLTEPMLGLELLLFYLPHFRHQGVDTRRTMYAVWGGIAAWLALYLFVIVAVMVGFGPHEAETLTWPLMEVVRRIFLTGLFFERLDILFLITLLISSSLAMTRYSYVGLEMLRQIFSLRSRAWQVWGCVLTVWGLAMLPANLAEIDLWRRHFLEPLGLIYLTAVPVLLIAAGLIRRDRRDCRALS